MTDFYLKSFLPIAMKPRKELAELDKQPNCRNVYRWNVFLIECLKCTLCGLRDFSFITIWLCLQLVADF